MSMGFTKIQPCMFKQGKPCPCSAMPKDVDMWGRANTLWQGGQFLGENDQLEPVERTNRRPGVDRTT